MNTPWVLDVDKSDQRRCRSRRRGLTARAIKLAAAQVQLGVKSDAGMRPKLVPNHSDSKQRLSSGDLVARRLSALRLVSGKAVNMVTA